MQVNVPNIGLVNFPDSMSQDEVASTIKTKLLPQQGSQQPKMAAPSTAISPLPVLGLGGQIKQALTTPPAWIENYQPQSLGGAVAKATGETILNPQTLSMALPVGAVWQGLSRLGEVGSTAWKLGALGKTTLATGFTTPMVESVKDNLKQPQGELPNELNQRAANVLVNSGLAGLGVLAPALEKPTAFKPLDVPVTPAQRLANLNFAGKEEWQRAEAQRRAQGANFTAPSKGAATDLSSAATPPKDVPQTATIPTTKTASPVSSSQVATPVSGTANLGMLDQVFRHKMANVNGTISVGEQAGLLQPQEAAALRGQLKLLGMKANAGEDVTTRVELLSKQAKDMSQYRLYSQRMTRATDPTAQQDLFQKLETIKNQYGGMPPKIGEQVNEIQPSGNSGTRQQEAISQGQVNQGLPQESKIQSASEKQVFRAVTGNERPNVSSDVQGNGGEVKYPLSAKDGKMFDALGREVNKEHKLVGGSVDKIDKTSKEGGFVIAPREMWKTLFSGNTGTKIPAEQMWNRIKNVLGEQSGTFQALSSMGLKNFLSTPKSVEEVQNWAEENSPKVEVRKFGTSQVKTPALDEANQLSHEIETAGFRIGGDGRLTKRGSSIVWEHDNPNVPREIVAKAKRFNELLPVAENEKKQRKLDQSHWQSIAPKSEQDMPGYVEIAVVKPLKQPKEYSPTIEKYRENTGEQFPSSHNFPPNTLGFVRGYMETLPHAKDTVSVMKQAMAMIGKNKLEQRAKDYLVKDKTLRNADIMPSPEAVAMEHVARLTVDGKYGEQPLAGKKVFHVIEVQSDWAQKVRDLEQSAKATTDPSLNSSVRYDLYRQRDPLLPHYERLALKAAIDHARSEGADAIAISDAKTAMMTEGHDRIGNPQTYRDAGEEPIIRQQEGMRLHYDRTLPKIAEELTGQKGEKVSFGEHKMAYNNKGTEWADNPNTPPHATMDWQESLQPTKNVRKDLIFRNEKGEPKIDVSARMYDISKAKKDFSLYGRTGSILPESKAAKAFKEVGAKEQHSTIVSESLKKLDSLKSTGKDIYDAMSSTHAWKSWWLKRQGYDLPKIEAISPTFANSVSSYANSQVASVLRANANISKVLGDKADNLQFRKQLGGIIYEDMRRAEGGIGNSVLQLKNSPFSSEEQYQNALKNPEMQQALARWKELVQKPATEMHEKLGGQLAESGQKTGAFGNLIAVMQDEGAKENLPNSPSTVGPLSTMKKGSAFSKERKFSGQEYNLDAKDMAFRMMTKNAQQAALRDMYAVGEKEGLLKLLKQGDETPLNMIRQKNPVTLRTVVKDGETFHTSAYPAFDSRVASTLSQALQLDRPLSHLLDTPAIHAASQIVIKTQVAMGIDLGFHTFNDVVAVANSPKGLLALPQKAIAVAKANQDLVANNPAVQEELARMAESGITFRGDSLGGWSSRALKVADTVTRVVLNREYEQLVSEKKVVDSPAERRRYINGRAGQYNKRFMTWFQQGMQESGLGAFNVAGRNFNRLAIGNLTFSPGVKARSNVDALRLRLGIAAGIATAALIVPSAINVSTTGSAHPEGTEFGDIVPPDPRGLVKGEYIPWKKKDGTYEVLNMRKWTMLARGGRASGLGAVMNEQVLPRIKGEQPASIKQTLKDSATDIGRTALAPFSGPPVNLASTLLTGKTELGFGYDQRTAGEKAPYVKAAIGTLNPLVGPVVTQKQQGGSIGEGIAQRLGSVVGLQSSQSPFSIIRNRATQYKLKNKIGSDDNQSYGPSEYLPLKNALLQGNVEQAKQEYQQLLHDKSQNESISDNEAKKQAMMSIQKEFTRLENFRFVNKESEETFKAQLSPEQRSLYQKAVEQQKQIADKFFNEIQGKMSNEKKNAFPAPSIHGFKMKKFTMLDDSNPEHRAIAYALLNKANGNVELAKQLAEQQGYSV